MRAAAAGDEAELVLLWAQVEALHARIAPRFFRAAPPPVERVRQAIAAGGEHGLLVAERDGRVVGLVSLQLYDTPPGPSLAPRRRAMVEEIVVEKAARRGGVGRALMDAAAAWSGARGAEELLLTVWAENRAAERFYRAIGYRPVSRVLGRAL